MHAADAEKESLRVVTIEGGAWVSRSSLNGCEHDRYQKLVRNRYIKLKAQLIHIH